MQRLPRRRFVATGVALAVAGCSDTGDEASSTTNGAAGGTEEAVATTADAVTVSLPFSLRTALEPIPTRADDRPLQAVRLFALGVEGTEPSAREFVDGAGLTTSSVDYLLEVTYEGGGGLMAISGSFSADLPTLPEGTELTPATYRERGRYVGAVRDDGGAWEAGVDAVDAAIASPGRRLLTDVPAAATVAPLADAPRIELRADPDPDSVEDLFDEAAIDGLRYAASARSGPEDSIPDRFAYGFDDPAAVPDSVSSKRVVGSLTTTVDETGRVLVVERSRASTTTQSGS